MSAMWVFISRGCWRVTAGHRGFSGLVHWSSSFSSPVGGLPCRSAVWPAPATCPDSTGCGVLKDPRPPAWAQWPTRPSPRAVDVPSRPQTCRGTPPPPVSWSPGSAGLYPKMLLPTILPTWAPHTRPSPQSGTHQLQLACIRIPLLLAHLAAERWPSIPVNLPPACVLSHAFSSWAAAAALREPLLPSLFCPRALS